MNDTLLDITKDIAKSVDISVSEEKMKEITEELPFTDEFAALQRKMEDMMYEEGN